MTTTDNLPSNSPDQTPSTARMYDYFLGGTNNLLVDRIAAATVTELIPNTRDLVWENRYFVQRAVRFLARDGIRQFLDIGAGLPTQGNVHEIVSREAPNSRTVYVDHDPTVLHHPSVAALPPSIATMIPGDLRDPAAILDHPALNQLIDLTQPTAVILAAILHFVSTEEDPGRLVAELRDALAPGSYLVLSHLTSDGPDPGTVASTEEVYQRASSPLTFRDRATIEGLFGNFSLIPPASYVPADGTLTPTPRKARAGSTRVSRANRRARGELASARDLGVRLQVIMVVHQSRGGTMTARFPRSARYRSVPVRVPRSGCVNLTADLPCWMVT
jgi:SAM-dependent methyltransferase